MALTGEVRKVAPDGTQTTLAFLPIRPDVQPCGNSFGLAIMGALALDHQGNVYASINSCNVPDIGIWKVTPQGQAALLTPLPIPMTPGPNGVQVFRDEVYVSVSSRAHVVAFPVNADGSAGAGRVHASGVGLDDFAFDVRGNLYGTTDPFNTVVRIAPDGTQMVLLTAEHGLDGPTAAAFGVGPDSKSLYITNAAFPFFPGPAERRPSLMRLDVGVAGHPRP